MTSIRSIESEGERWISLNDVKRALCDPELQQEALEIVKLGHDKQAPPAEIMKMVAGSFIARGLGEIGPDSEARNIRMEKIAIAGLGHLPHISTNGAKLHCTCGGEACFPREARSHREVAQLIGTVITEFVAKHEACGSHSTHTA